MDSISSEYGIPIVNKRISVTPIAMLLGAAPDADPVMYAKALDRAAKAAGAKNFIGGFGALVHKGFSAGDRRLIQAIPRALAETDIVCSSVNIRTRQVGYQHGCRQADGRSRARDRRADQGQHVYGRRQAGRFLQRPRG